jgi:HEPN domain-containing protein
MDEAERELIRSWLTKASHDLVAARLLAAGPAAVLGVAVYHCQQAAEKALNGFLVYHDQRAERTNDVGLLLERASQIEPSLSILTDAAERLTPYATAYRYPEIADQPEREDF